MLLLDTNILSAMMRPQPSPALATWIAAQPIGTLFTAAICQAEILAGLAIMPAGRRRHALAAAAQAMFAEDFAGRVLPFDAAAASHYAALFAARRQSGRPSAAPDLLRVEPDMVRICWPSALNEKASIVNWRRRIPPPPSRFNVVARRSAC